LNVLVMAFVVVVRVVAGYLGYENLGLIAGKCTY
jgi:hypothetical protein